MSSWLQRQYRRDHYLRNKERAKAQSSAFKKRQTALLLDYIRSIKEGTACADCGRCLPHYVMDFDHVRGTKRKGVADMARLGVALATLKAEIAKCELVCANCHRVRSWDRLREQERLGDVAVAEDDLRLFPSEVANG